MAFRAMIAQRSTGVAQEVAARAPRAGVFLDVDGTLAPIVARPELARVLPEIGPTLARLGWQARGRRGDLRAPLRTGSRARGRRRRGDRRDPRAGGRTADVEPRSSRRSRRRRRPSAPGSSRRAPPPPSTSGRWRIRKRPRRPRRAPLAAIAATHDLEIVPGQADPRADAGRAAPQGRRGRADRAGTRSWKRCSSPGTTWATSTRSRRSPAPMRRGLWTCASRGARATTRRRRCRPRRMLVVDGPSGMAALLASIADELDRRAAP